MTDCFLPGGGLQQLGGGLTPGFLTVSRKTFHMFFLSLIVLFLVVTSGIAQNIIPMRAC